MINLQDIPASHGTYILFLFLAQQQRIEIGRLGVHHFPVGLYAYIGSARGVGGLRARVGRHLRGDGVLHWHIDYLRTVGKVRDVFYTVTDRPLECAWSRSLAQLPDAVIPVPHFGASDCRLGCEAHLIAFPPRSNVAWEPHFLPRTSSTPIVHLHFR